MTKGEKIIEALVKSPHRWNTPRAIAKETGISVPDVTRVLEGSPEIVRARRGTKQGEPLFARREKKSLSASRDEQAKARTPPEELPSTRFKYLLLLPLDSSANRLRDAIATTIRREGAEPLFLESMEFKPGALWVEELSGLIRASDAVIADLSRQTPNIMFELGMAHAAGKPLILLIDENATTNLPTTLAGFDALAYTPENLSAFVSRLAKSLHQLAGQKGAV